MNIVMFTNTYLPHVGGVARSVAGFAEVHRRRGHRVMVVAPHYEGDEARHGRHSASHPDAYNHVVRVPAIQNWNGSDFSVPMPVPGLVSSALDRFRPDIVHSHHPFLLGDSALRASAARELPLVFTHHTLYERYTHYVPGDVPSLQKAAIDLAVGYCNLCDAVIAPSESIRGLLLDRQVKTPIEVIPTGVEIEVFASGDRQGVRERHGIPKDAFVVGHVGRLAPEKNLDFLAGAIGRFMVDHPSSHMLLAGLGPSLEPFRERLGNVLVHGAGDGEAAVELERRLHHVGLLESRRDLADVYAAMDVFAFASTSETQGMVLTEAMAAGAPVVALDASGVREVVEDRINGRLLTAAGSDDFADALAWIADLDAQRRQAMAIALAATSRRFSIEHTASKTRELYRGLIDQSGFVDRKAGAWHRARLRFAEELKIWRNIGHALAETLKDTSEGSP